MHRSVALLCLVALLAPSARADDKSDLQQALAGGLLELAAWCEDRGLTDEGRALLEEARSLAPGHPALAVLEPKLAAGSTASDAVRRSYERRRASYARKFATLYTQLHRLPHPDKAAAEHDGYLVRAFAHDRRAVGRLIEAAWREALAAGQLDRAHRLLTGAQAVDEDPKRAEALASIELRLAETTPVLKKATTHPIEYYLVLPRGWSKDRTWPVLVTVEGAGCNWRGNCNAFLGARGDLPFIIVTPWTFWNTNQLNPDKYNYDAALVDRHQSGDRMGFDEAGLLAILADVGREYGGRDRIFITGFSGGGNLTWRMVFGHPDRVAAASPACANFHNPGPISDHPDRKDLPVLAFQGDQDKYLEMLDGQWERARSLCEENGFENVRREMVPGVGHSTCAGKVMAFFADQLEGQGDE